MHRLFFIFFILLPAAGMGQIKCSLASIDFGTIERSTNRVVDITITNSGSDTQLLRSTIGREYSFLFSSKKIASDSSITLRVQFNPLNKGKWNDELALYFTTLNEPVIIKVSANVEFVDRSANPSCPSFNDQPVNCCPNDPLTVVVKDANSLSPIKDARVRIIEQGILQQTWKTNRQGMISDEVPISYYFLIADADGYSAADTATYINRKSNYFELLLVPKEVEETIPQPEPPVVIDVVVPPIEQPETATVAANTPIVVDGKLAPHLRTNNVVFLVDVSESMAKQGKLDVLKNSMFNLFHVLRPNDKISVMTYATHTEVVVDGVSGNEVDKLTNSISQLSAGGMTAGVKGFRTAYEMGLRNFQENGNNQVIVATDGAFRASDNDKIKQLVTEYREKGLKTTIIGVRCTEKTALVLKELTEIGGGSFLNASDFDSGEELLRDEIIRQSSKE